MFERPKSEKKYSAHTDEDETHHSRKENLQPDSILQKMKQRIEHVVKFENKDAEKIREILKGFDMTVLSNILREYAGKSGTELGNFVMPDINNIEIINDPTIARLGSSNSETRKIKLNIVDMIDASGVVDSELVERVAVHEFLHYVSSTTLQIRTKSHLLSSVTIQERKTGVAKYSTEVSSNILGAFEKTGETLKGTYLNEGLTELIAQDVYQEYLHRVGSKSEFDDSYEYTFSPYGAYEDNQYSVHSLIIFYSALTSTPETVVKNSFIRAYFRNGKISLDDVEEDFSSEHQELFDSFQVARKLALSVLDEIPEKFFLEKELSLLIENFPPETRTEFKRRIAVLEKNLDEQFDH